MSTARRARTTAPTAQSQRAVGRTDRVASVPAVSHQFGAAAAPIVLSVVRGAGAIGGGTSVAGCGTGAAGGPAVVDGRGAAGTGPSLSRCTTIVDSDGRGARPSVGWSPGARASALGGRRLLAAGRAHLGRLVAGCAHLGRLVAGPVVTRAAEQRQLQRARRGARLFGRRGVLGRRRWRILFVRVRARAAPPATVMRVTSPGQRRQLVRRRRLRQRRLRQRRRRPQRRREVRHRREALGGGARHAAEEHLVHRLRQAGDERRHLREHAARHVGDGARCRRTPSRRRASS